jgi:predicted dehydrogenase
VERWEEVAESSDVDALVITLPNALHAETALAGLSQGKHVFLEKPLAPSMAEGLRIREAWRASERVCMVDFNYRYNRLYLQAHRALRSGELGKVVGGQSVFTIKEDPLPAWKASRASGGGALLDLGSHHIDLACHLLESQPVAVSASISSARSEHDTAAMTLHFEDGVDVQGFFALDATYDEHFELFGTRARMRVDRPRYQDVWIGRGREGLLDRLGSTVTGISYIREKRACPGHEPSQRAALDRFLRAVRGETIEIPDPEAGLRALRIVEAAEEAARSGVRQTIELLGGN